MTNNEYEDRLRELTASYADSLAVTLAEIDRCRQLLASGWDAEQAGEIQRHCHQLAGSAATFGFPEVSRYARDVEHVINPVLREQRAPSAGELQQIEQGLTALRAQLAKR